MKKSLKVLVLVFVCMILTGCTDFYNGRRPTDLGPALWVSEDPEAWFRVKEREEGEPLQNTKGQITIDGVTTDFVLIFDGAVTAAFCEIQEDETSETMYSFQSALFTGRCSYGRKEFTVTIKSDREDILKGKVEEITFVKQEETEEEKQ